MKISTNFAPIVLGLLLAGNAAAPRPALAHEANCPSCKLKLVQNTKTQDNEVVVKYGNKRIEYRCVYCIFADQKKFKGDITVLAPSEKVGAPVVLKRVDGKWSAPDGARFLNSFKKHKACAAESRAFSSKAAFDAYVKKNNIQDAKALTLNEMLAVSVKK